MAATSQFQPTLPLRGATERREDRGGRRVVSTHAPLAGSDSAFAVPNWHTRQFQPTLPLRGATLALAASLPPPMFQPTLPLRGATWWTGQRKSPRCRFNPRSPCGERPDDPTVVSRGVAVSTHAPLAGSDLRHEGIDPAGESFNPRSPCGERPEPKRTTLTKEGFNPRSPCGERRTASPIGCLSRPGFNPRSPCGERLFH